jgi:O-antigen/teichoic acid export membrane protein
MMTAPNRRTDSGWQRLLARRRNPIATNLFARVGAIASLSLASVLVARVAGPAGVGTLVLLRVLPWLAGLLLGTGCYGAAPYFLSGPGRSESRYRTTIPAMTLIAGVVGAVLWVAVAPLLQQHFYSELSVALVALASVTVITQVLESTAMACSQGFDDLDGSNRIIFLDEFLFLPVYGLFLLTGMDPYLAMVVALPLVDLMTAVPGWVRLWRLGFFTNAGRPSLTLARRVAAFGFRAQLGSIALLLNARLDFAIVGALVGPAALGIYAVASRYAELVRLPSLAMNYVLYPSYARDGRTVAADKARTMIRQIGWIPAAAAVPMALAGPIVLPLFFGPEFSKAALPAAVLLVGLVLVGVGGIISAFLTGVGRPGLNSLAIAAGLPVTLGLDLLLIPPFGVTGAAAASAAAYLTTTAVLLVSFKKVARATSPTAETAREVSRTESEVSR